MKLRKLVGALAAIALMLVAPISTSSGASTSRISSTSPCGVATTTQYTHVVWIMLENVGYSVVGSHEAPYFNQLVAKCGLATHYYAASHPSLPNYIALTSGSTQGISDDGEPSTHPLSVPSIFSQLGTNWRALDESMPSPCDGVTSGVYAARHNPAVYYTSIASTCQQNDVPLTLPLNLSAGFTLITPNICDDMHSCPVASGDAWLHRYVPQILSSPQYQKRSLVLFITFDENDNAASNQVPTVVISPTTPRGEKVAAKFSHYSLLKTTELLLHLGQLGNAATAPSMIPSFHL